MECEDGVQNGPETETVAALTSEGCEKTDTVILPSPMDEDPKPENLRNAMLDHLANNKTAHFKSQQVGEPELNFEEKRKIAEDILARNPGEFLSRFGHYLKSDHLDYFTVFEKESENYEVIFHLKQLRRFHCRAKNKVDVKNRRFEALKKLVKEGTYFSEKQMKLRNPLLYEQLIGQYLTKKEVEDRKLEAMNEANTWVNLLMAQIERDEMVCLRKRQQDDEDGAIEEVDTSDEDEDDKIDSDDKDDESDDSDDDSDDRDDVSDKSSDMDTHRKCVGKRFNDDFEKKNNDSCKNHKKRKLLPGKEKNLLREEFVTNMYRSFLEGKDEDFDYSEVDLNPEYECLAVRSQDEEEKYFDSETPELVADEPGSGEEDELDTYMKNLKPEATPNDLAGDLNILL